MAITPGLIDIFFPNPRQVVVVRSWGYEVGDLHAPGIHSLSLAQRKVQGSWFHGLRIRLRIGVREEMAFLSREGIHWIRAHSVRTGPTLRLPGGVEISVEMLGLCFHKLRVQKGAEQMGRVWGLAAAALSPRGRWMVALWDRLPGGQTSGWSIWRWTRGAFRLEREEEMPKLPEAGWTVRIAPGLDWAVRVGNRVWGIAGLPALPGSGTGRSREVVRRIFPVPFGGEVPGNPGDPGEEEAR